MGFFKDILRTIFSKTKKKEIQENNNVIDKEIDGFTLNEELSKTILKKNPVSGYKLKEPYCPELKSQEILILDYDLEEKKRQSLDLDYDSIADISQAKEVLTETKNKTRKINLDSVGSSVENETKINLKEEKIQTKRVIGRKTFQNVIDYLLVYGSIDALTFKQKFKVKSIQNFIWVLRKEGYIIKTEKIGMHNQLGEAVMITNYKLVSVSAENIENKNGEH